MSKAIQLIKLTWARGNDVCLGIDTAYGSASKAEHQQSVKHADAAVYQAVDYWNIRRVIRFLAPGPNDVFYDIGCGKGRVVCCAARHRLRRVVGIDFDGALCELARQNARRLRGSRTSIDIRQEDAAVAEISDGTIYFMFNPFGEDTMRDFLSNIQHSLQISSREITIVYCNPVLARLFDACTWLQRIHELKNMTGGKIILWKNRL